ncbi:YciI family protein [Aquabacterium humicola]|uniref:YciI family protein n=1 Tax=Aquabacterium humicola TaxID=3237377 RepID=UPI002543EBB4|nr:YciI family protein [Rubrivivax pictus]
MRFMIMVRANALSESERSPDADQAVMAAMADYHEALAQAGVLLDGNGLQPSRSGWRIHYTQGKGRVIDGPFAESKELIAGYTLIQVNSREEALEWSRRFPSPFGNDECEIEVRQLYELEDFDSPDVERFREIGIGRR